MVIPSGPEEQPLDAAIVRSLVVEYPFVHVCPTYLPLVLHQILSAMYHKTTGVLRIQTWGCVLRLQLSKKYPIPTPCGRRYSNSQFVHEGGREGGYGGRGVGGGGTRRSLV